MNSELKLLIVEDEVAARQMFKDTIENYNKKNDIKIIPEFVSNLEDALIALSNPIFDCVQLDLKLRNYDENGEGNEVLKVIKGKLRLPVIVFSGNTSDLDEDYKDDNALIKVYSRDEKQYAEVLQEFVDIYSTGLTNLFKPDGLIEKTINDIFWKRISGNIRYILDERGSINDIEKMLARRLFAYLQEYLDLDDNGGFDQYHPSEIYMIPPVKNKLFTGDICYDQGENKYYIVLSPACDLAQGKAKQIVLGTIESIEMECLMQLKRNLDKEDKKEEAKVSIINLFRNNYSNKYHFLPNTNEFVGGFINFQKITTVHIKDIEEQFTIVASVNSNFVKEITARFSQYYSRQGQPDINIDGIIEKVIS